MPGWMEKLLCCLLLISGLCCHAEPATTHPLYIKSYGDAAKPALIYIHGGPRGNATLFEGTTAQALADRGFYVIVYDRRGEGRSADPTASLTFNEAFNDLNLVIDSLKLTQVSLLGHSFGGIVAALYSQAYPEKVKQLVLIGALVHQQQTYDHILRSASLHTKKDIQAQIQAIAVLNNQSEAYRRQVYQLAASLGFFEMPRPTAQYQQLKTRYQQSEFSRQNIRNDEAPGRFYQNERLVNTDTTAALQQAKAAGVQLFALYGQQDGIFSAQQLNAVQQLVGSAAFALLDNCSHYPFVDQQQAFLQQLTQWLHSTN